MNERDESERCEVLTARAGVLAALKALDGPALIEAIRTLERAIESREREQTLALLEALRDSVRAIESAHGQVEDTHDQIGHCECLLNGPWLRGRAVLASYEAAHALQVAHEEVKG